MKNKKLPINVFQSIPLGWPARAAKAKMSLAALARACDVSYETVFDATKGSNVTLKKAIIIENKLLELGV